MELFVGIIYFSLGYPIAYVSIHKVITWMDFEFDRFDKFMSALFFLVFWVVWPLCVAVAIINVPFQIIGESLIQKNKELK